MTTGSLKRCHLLSKLIIFYKSLANTSGGLHWVQSPRSMSFFQLIRAIKDFMLFTAKVAIDMPRRQCGNLPKKAIDRTCENELPRIRINA